MITKQVDTNRRTIIKGLSLSAGLTMFLPQVSRAYSLLNEFPGRAGYPGWHDFVLGFASRDEKGTEGPHGFPEGIRVDSDRISVKIPDYSEDNQVVPIRVSFDDSNLPHGEWCSELTAILVSKIHVVDELGRHFKTETQQVLFQTTFSKQTIPSLGMRIKLFSLECNIVVIARVKKQDGDFYNFARVFDMAHESGFYHIKTFYTTKEAASNYEKCDSDNVSRYINDCVKRIK